MSKRAYTPKDIEQKKYDCFDWSGAWLSVFGNPAVNSMWLVQGMSASGKSSFVMQLAKKLCEYGPVLYLSYEEGVDKEFQRRLQYLHMSEVQGKFTVVTDETPEEVDERLSRAKSACFVVMDSFQAACDLYGWSYEAVMSMMRRYSKKGFVVVSQEHKGQPLGKPALRLKYMATMKVRVAGYRAYCQGRAAGEPGSYYTVWEEGVLMTSNNV